MISMRSTIYSILYLMVMTIMPGCTPLSPIQAGVSTAVMLEDMTEDPDEDAKESTFLEWADDVLSFPKNTVVLFVRSTVAFFWSMGDAMGGSSVTLATREATVNDYLPVTWSSSPLPFEQTERGRRYTCDGYDMVQRYRTPACTFTMVQGARVYSHPSSAMQR
ncbi:MAG: hypothetical protein Q7U76_13020 [Nitrospirota bacterium]|nr:hypothetical protein [Nitrospirota bacterium]